MNNFFPYLSTTIDSLTNSKHFQFVLPADAFIPEELELLFAFKIEEGFLIGDSLPIYEYKILNKDINSYSILVEEMPLTDEIYNSEDLYKYLEAATLVHVILQEGPPKLLVTTVSGEPIQDCDPVIRSANAILLAAKLKAGLNGL